MSSKSSREELERVFSEVFNRFKRRRILYDEFEECLESRGYSEDDVLEIWDEAIRLEVIDSGVIPIDAKPVVVISRPRGEDKEPEIVI